MPRKVSLKKNDWVANCPICKNNTIFKAFSAQVAEDYCNVWVECKCGYDPTRENSDLRLEDVWGGVNNDNVISALSCWNEAINLSPNNDHRKSL